MFVKMQIVTQAPRATFPEDPGCMACTLRRFLLLLKSLNVIALEVISFSLWAAFKFFPREFPGGPVVRT